MSRVRIGALFGATATIGMLAFASVDCAQPTEIIVDVRAELVLCEPAKGIKRTGIAVASYDKIESERLEIFEGPGCDSPGDRIGTLTITPSGAKDEAVAFKVVAGVDKPADQCAPPYDGCIVAIRKERFAPGKSKTVTVILAAACIGKYCGPDLECNPKGQCVSTEDGGVGDGGDPPRPEGGPEDGGPDAIPEAGVDGCANATCLGTCNAGKCEVDCSTVGCSGNVVCGGPNVECLIHCATVDTNCTNVRCEAPGNKCTFDCNTTGGNGNHGCRDVACASKTCDVTCSGRQNSCNGVYVDGGVNIVRCLDGQQEEQCNNVHCESAGGTCSRECTNLTACGPITTCNPTAACNAWSDGG